MVSQKELLQAFDNLLCPARCTDRRVALVDVTMGAIQTIAWCTAA